LLSDLFIGVSTEVIVLLGREFLIEGGPVQNLLGVEGTDGD